VREYNFCLVNIKSQISHHNVNTTQLSLLAEERPKNIHSKRFGGEARGGDDAEPAQWFPINDELDMAFDHNKILNNYWQWR
jgi:hypothetical protein